LDWEELNNITDTIYMKYGKMYKKAVQSYKGMIFQKDQEER